MSNEPEPLDHPAVWHGAQLLERPDFEVPLDSEEVGEIAAALDATSELELEQLDAESFRLPRLALKLAAVQHALEHGSGASRLRGLPIAELGEERTARAFWGMMRHIGTPVSQSAAGERLLHVRDEGFEPGDPRFRGPHSNRRLSFHTDRCDVIAFACVRAARAGGENDVISSMAVYNALATRHPDALRTLRQAFPYLRHTVDAGNENAYTMVPVFAEWDGHFAASFLRVLIDRADRAPNAPDLTGEQRAALDTLESVAEDPDLYARFRLEAGDVLLLNNWVTLHRRTAFEDHDPEELRRHLLRLWLAVPNSRPLDPRFEEHFGSVRAGAVRGGMRSA